MNIKYTDMNGNVTIDNTYQTTFPSFIYHENVNDECVYIIEKDPVKCTSQTFIQTEEGFTFVDGLKYFIRITDLNSAELVGLTRIYQTGFEPGASAYGFCESSKCKVPIGYKEIGSFELVNKELKNNDVAIKSFDGDLSEYSDIYFVVKGTAPYGVFLDLNDSPVVKILCAVNSTYAPVDVSCAVHLTGTPMKLLNKNIFLGNGIIFRSDNSGPYVEYDTPYPESKFGTNTTLRVRQLYGNYGPVNLKITLFGKKFDRVVLNAL